jgi:hypothetical protein
MATEPIRRLAAVNVPGVAIVGRFLVTAEGFLRGDIFC